MQSTQLLCPHCQSMLTFGQDITPGMTVPCLICGMTFTAPYGNAGTDMGEASPPAAPPEAAAPPVALGAAPAMPPAPPIAAPAVPPANAGAAPAVALAATVPAARAPSPAPRPAIASAGSGQALLAGGLVFAGLAVLMIGGMSLVLWLAFGRHTPASEIDSTPAPVYGAAGTTAQPPKSAAPQEVDLADLKKPDSPPPSLPLAERKDRSSEPPPAPEPIVPIRVIAGGGGVIDQQRIDAAIDKGVRYLKATQDQERATWSGGYDIGFTSLAGLTLLECKVPPNDPSIVKAAGFVRHNVDNLHGGRETYQLSLAILFLDRLGDPKDDAIIQRLALRLLTGQNLAGGWTYQSRHPLAPPETQQFLVFLKSHRPATPLAKAIMPAGGPLDRQTTMPVILPKQVQEPKASEPILKNVGGTLPDAKDGKVNKALDGKVPGADGAKQPDPKQPRPRKIAPIPLQNLLPRLRNVEIARFTANKTKDKYNKLLQPPHGEDNSNTQFALMGLWAARRHDVPAEYSLLLAQQRFLRSKNPDGGWGYHWGHGSTNTMTCVGLIGLAMGHGVSADMGKNKEKQRDTAIQQGLTALGKYIGTPSANPQQPNLYFLWSLERVGMLYDLKTIGGKDWYAWGAQALVANQKDQKDMGYWTGGGYPGANNHCDTCFALLFLKRSNLVPDLTENLRLYMVIRDPEANSQRR